MEQVQPQPGEDSVATTDTDVLPHKDDADEVDSTLELSPVAREHSESRFTEAEEHAQEERVECSEGTKLELSPDHLPAYQEQTEASGSRNSDEKGAEIIRDLDRQLSIFARTRSWNFEKGYDDLLPLYKAIIHGNWETAESFLDDDPDLVTSKISARTTNPVYIAIQRRLPLEFIQKLVDRASPESLAMGGSASNQWTGLHAAAMIGYTEAAKVLVEKNPILPQILEPFEKLAPIHYAALYGHKETVCYLLSVTKDEDPSPFKGTLGASLLTALIIAEFYGLALYLLKRYPSLAVEKDFKGLNALTRLAERGSHAFESGRQVGLLEHLFYKCIFPEKGNVPQPVDVENPAANPTVYSEEPKSFGFFQSTYNKKLKHKQALQLGKLLCAETVKYPKLTDQHLSAFGSPILTAAIFGIPELVLEIISAFPDAIWYRNRDSRTLFHLAVLYRKENVFNLVYQMSFQKNYLMSYKDKFENNMLHLAGKLVPSDKISGAALQMQHELQWFKAVEQVVQPSYKEFRNKDGKRPQQVFTEEHKELVAEGEKWMKNTASSCSFVAALVATVVFAAAFTIPGGNNGDGSPIFMKETSFLIFIVSDALALFTSSSSVLMFLGILTSRYAEEDFLMALPARMIIGLLTLFVSIASMLVAFSSSLHILLFHKVKWIAVPIGVFACCPVSFFAMLQFPLLVKMISSTFGPSIFHPLNKETIF
ncbi:hypothetical protein K2173_009357 [Erythroxylum novogranatense]|uniref:PGG domain-containing protein n=1 Tax=Erythroxylum novogranatense TaxID=1862640 RepID=A0AAV8U4Z1_9ROSI|nr:hypothetical protein K2173_009357 [Erythroxylum novogranatense]